ncbi:beta-galactosidase [Microbacterium sp. YY-01]|uniref:beta-galactosidase n=1 Tax=Microbacterium sp. YY-01 TaxID=3421634 RepID=UPI003D180897
MSTAESAQPAVLLGTAYYPEYRTNANVDRELSLMREAGIGVIRVAESQWSDWEPREGEFRFEPLAELLDAAYRHGLRVIVGTPTYAIPPWLQVKHPELAAHRADGTAIPWGARQEVDFTSPVFRTHAEPVIREMLTRLGQHPAVIGVQVDNEPGLLLMHNPTIVDEFRRRLRDRYGDTETLNREWGLSYWSHRITDWSQLWTPGGNTTPAYDLAWREFQADLTAEFIGWQAEIARQILPADRFVTTCIAYNRPAQDDHTLGKHLDIPSGNAYYLPQDHLSPTQQPGEALHWYATTLSGMWQLADRMRATHEGPFLVTETGGGPIGGSHMELPPYPGQLRQAAWAFIARGARMVSYWQWQTLHSGAEVAWGGILPHSDKPGRIYAEVSRIGRDLAAAGNTIAELVPDADVGIVWSYESRWVHAFQPPFARGDDPDRQSYERIVDATYRAALDAGAQVDFVSAHNLNDADELLRRWPVLLVPALTGVPDAALEVLADYVQAGGTVLMTVATAQHDELARGRTEGPLGPLAQAAGVEFEESSTLSTPLEVVSDVASDAVSTVPTAPTADTTAAHFVERRVDLVRPQGAQVLARFTHPFFAEWPALTRHQYGAGTAWLLPGFASRTLFRDAVAAAMDEAGVQPRRVVAQHPDATTHLTTHSAVNADGRRVWFVHNWSWNTVSVPLERAVVDAIDGEERDAGDTLELQAWDVRVLMERDSNV